MKILLPLMLIWCVIDFAVFITYPDRLSKLIAPHCESLERYKINGGNGSHPIPFPQPLPANRAEPLNTNIEYWGVRDCHQLSINKRT